MRLFLLIAAAGLTIAPVPALAELPLPKIDRFEPLGGRAGSTIEIKLHGNDLDEVTGLLFDDPGLRAEHVKEKTFKVVIGDGVAPGTYDVRAVTPWGLSNPRLLQVMRESNDVAEKEPNQDAATAQPIEIGTAIDGISDGNGQDLFRVTLKKDQRIVCDCWSARLETQMDPGLAVFSADGRSLATSGDYFGRDPFIDFVAPAEGEYLIEVRDLVYRGGYPYRLLVHQRPSVEAIFPRAAQAGKGTTFEVVGRNLPDGQASPYKLNGLPLQKSSLNWNAPSDLLPLGRFTFREHPIQYSVLPTAATDTITGAQVTAFDDAFPVVVTSHPTSVEIEDNNQREKAQRITVSTVLSGRFDQPRDADWYVLEPGEGEGGQYWLDVYCERIGGRADPYLALVDEGGRRVKELDDFGHRINAFDGHLRDPSGEMQFEAKKKYYLLVQDRYQRGGPRYQYVLRVRRNEPDFYVAAMHGQIHGNQPEGLTIRRGGAMFLDLVVHRQDGMNSPITVTAESLPPGVHARPTTLPDPTRGSIVFWADDDAPIGDGEIRLVARAQVGERTIEREVRPYTRSYDNVGSRPMTRLMAAVRDRSPYGLAVSPDRIDAQPGQTVKVKLVARRHWPDAKNPINYQPHNLSGPLGAGNGSIGPDQQEVTVDVTVRDNAQAGEYTIGFLGQSQVPFHKNPESKDRPQTLVSVPSQPLTIVVTKPEKK